ncbi:hypothetical protein V6280_11695 [Serratia marcescens]|uniref:MrpH family fimbial adhesin n=1 Tax=Serratia marcescens TaxID=615 RepID=UPI003701A731
MKNLAVFVFFILILITTDKAIAEPPGVWQVDWQLNPNAGSGFTIRSVEANRSANDRITCSIFRRCRLTLTLQPGGRFNVWVSGGLSVTGTNMSYYQFLTKLNNEALPISGGFAGYRAGDCIDIGIEAGSGISTSSAGSTCDSRGGGISPPEPPAPPVVNCRLDGDVTLQHGSLLAASISGHMASGYSMLSCSGAANVRVRVVNNAGSRMLNLAGDNSLLSELKVNGVDGSIGSAIKVPNNMSVVPILFTSTLQKNGTVRSGYFSGSAMALVTFD